MKKLFILVISASVLLTGCVFPKYGKHRPKVPAESKVAKTSSSSSSSSSDSSTSASSESTAIVSKTLVGDLKGIHHRDTVTYRGDKLLKLRMELLSNLPEEASGAAATMSPEEMTAIIREGMESEPNYVEAKNMEGVTIEYSVTADKKLQAIVDLDFEKMDIAKVASLSFFKDLGLNDIKDVSPSMFILGMKLGGLKEE
ncbi:MULTISPECIES: SP0191 family lipoprotein [Streptococcus]|uniref:SP0191 family lipoprotein n=1 Tax=Streptococcus TaxID=1301 RepID=UPI00065FA758|nr:MULTISPECIES: SP0191 family lipoprotein [Streptococcus]MDL2431992.1 SP0191 family lipoprotein [Streptococcus sp. SC1]